MFVNQLNQAPLPWLPEDATEIAGGQAARSKLERWRFRSIHAEERL
jgi:hypothetical protein